MLKLRYLKKLIPEKIKRQIILKFVSSKDPQWMKFINSNHKKIFVFLAGFYQNLGDMALTYSQSEILKTLFPEADIILVSSTQTYGAVKTIRNIIRADDLVTITGGGNMDDMYISLEEARLHIIKSFPNNKIILFPQTMNFSDTKRGIQYREISHKIYAKHTNLTMFAREQMSLKKMRIAFPEVDIRSCPDTVLSLDKVEPKRHREGVTVCLRSDKEQRISRDEKIKLKKILQEKFRDINYVDTVDVSLEECSQNCYIETLEKFWDILRRSKLVITDRLHGMIFSAITGTPCIAIDNANCKISEVYTAWLKEIKYVRVEKVFNIDKILRDAKELMSSNITVTKFDLSAQFESLKKCCLE